MTVSEFLYYFFWPAAHILQIPIAVIMVRRRMVREFPAFFVYTCFQLLLNAVLFTMAEMDYFTKASFDPTNIAGGYISAGLRFAVIHEIFQQVFHSYPAMRNLGGKIFRWSTALLMVVAVLVVANSTGPTLNYLSVGIIVIDRAANIMQLGLLVLLVLLVKYLRLTWSTYVLPIAVGLGLYSSAMLVVAAFKAHYGIYFQPVLSGHIDRISYTLSTVIWFAPLLLPARASKPIESPVSVELENWNAALQRLLEQ